MILVDTSVWIDHLHHAEKELVELLGDDLVLSHTGVIEELALGSMREREAFTGFLSSLERCPSLTHEELMTFVEGARLWGRGLSVIDVHLLGSARLAGSAIWTRDKRFREAAKQVGVSVYEGR